MNREFRPGEMRHLISDTTVIRKLGWQRPPQKNLRVRIGRGARRPKRRLDELRSEFNAARPSDLALKALGVLPVTLIRQDLDDGRAQRARREALDGD
jgi:hypothetical protein